MSRNIWVSSDLHLFHSNILNFVDNEGKPQRSFKNVLDMNQHILDSHNSVVKKGDIWYNLGDVLIGGKDEFKTLWPKFNGSKRLIVGNHDDIPFLSKGGFFSKVQMWRRFPEYELILSHVPLHESSVYSSKDISAPLLSVHGHIHTRPSPSRMHYCVCVEQIDYTPVNIEDLAVIARERRKEWREKNS